MLKYGLKLDRVHTYVDLSLSQLEEKIMWVVEMTAFGTLNRAQQQEQIALVVIVNLGLNGFFMETEKEHKSDNVFGYDYDRVNKRFPGKPQSFPTAIDLTHPYKNFKEVEY